MWPISRSVFQSAPARLSRKGAIARPAASGLAAAVMMTINWVGAPAQAQIQTQIQAQSLVRPDLEVGTQDASVAELQAVLKLLGFYDGLVTGVYSEETSRAVGRFQTAAGLSMTGRVTAITWNKLFPPSGVVASGGTVAQGSSQGLGAIAPAPVPKPEPAPPAPPRPMVAVPQSSVPAAVQKPTPSPAAKPASKPAPMATDAEDPFPILREGAQGDAVARLQQFLQRRGLFDGGIDGDFGPMTLEAVKAAQEKLGLEPDGVVGPATWEALRR